MRDINVYGFIGDGCDETDMTATKFANELKEANGEAVTIHVNSAGGDVFDANTMAELLRAYQGESTCIIEGLAASAASFFALTADKVVIGDSALMMIHNPYSFSGGTAEDLRKTADFLDKVTCARRARTRALSPTSWMPRRGSPRKKRWRTAFAIPSWRWSPLPRASTPSRPSDSRTRRKTC